VTVSTDSRSQKKGREGKGREGKGREGKEGEGETLRGNDHGFLRRPCQSWPMGRPK
jgi:hypothetical protein